MCHATRSFQRPNKYVNTQIACWSHDMDTLKLTLMILRTIRFVVNNAQDYNSIILERVILSRLIIVYNVKSDTVCFELIDAFRSSYYKEYDKRTIS